MPINGIQMQKGLSLPEFIQLYGTEQQCEAALQKSALATRVSLPKMSWTKCQHIYTRQKRVYGIVVIVRIKPV